MHPTATAIDREHIALTASLIHPHIRRTPVVDVRGADFGLDAGDLHFKLEQLQYAGSFKTRGAFANLLSREVPQAGVVAASGGNHGAAVAYAAMTLGIPAKIFVPSISSPAKIERIRRYGAQLVVGGDRYADALAASEEWIVQSGALRCMHSISRIRCSAKARLPRKFTSRFRMSIRFWSRSEAEGSSAASQRGLPAMCG